MAAILILLALCMAPSRASAQTVDQFSNTTTGDIVDSTNCATTVTRSFSVGASYNVADVNFGLLLSHRGRSDLRITLTSPAGTSVQLMNGVGSGANNLNVLFDDEAAAAISTHTTNDAPGGSPPPYSRTFRPGSPMSAFDGQNAQGTWTMVMCDFISTDTGTFTRADLYITQAPASFADLSLTKTVSNGNPSPGANVTYTLTVSNAPTSNVSATGVTVLDTLPVGVSFVSSTGTGSYNNATGIWTVGTLAANSIASITITVSVTAASGTVVTNSAEIQSSSAADPDSIPNNGSTSEDDYGFVSFVASSTRTAGTPPTLICPVGTTVFDWDAITWSAGATSGSYFMTGIGTITFNISIVDGIFLSNASTGGQSPARQTNFSGGLSPSQTSLIQLVNMNTRESAAITTLSLPTAVPGVQFQLFDVDYAVSEFADRVTITGLFNGASVTPTLTNSVANYVIGNTAFGDGVAASISADGTVFVTFSTPVDTIVINYGNHSMAPANPQSQAISIHDLTFCRPQGNVSISKTSRIVSDGINGTNPKALPDAVLNYCVLVTNSGSSTATNFTFEDVIPATLTYVAESMLSGPSCSNVSKAEDDNATGPDETDPIGASISGNTITATATSIGPNSAFALSFNATVK
jgi:uncharacterized repeat protein (TIGR01451 family)